MTPLQRAATPLPLPWWRRAGRWSWRAAGVVLEFCVGVLLGLLLIEVISALVRGERD